MCFNKYISRACWWFEVVVVGNAWTHRVNECTEKQNINKLNNALIIEGNITIMNKFQI